MSDKLALWWVYSFPRADVASYHKVSILAEQTLTLAVLEASGLRPRFPQA